MDAVTVLDRVRGSWARTSFDEEGQAVTLGVVLTETRELIGDVMLQWTSAKHRSGAIGYVFDPRRSGNGYATEAAHRTLHLAFDDLRLHRVLARIVAGNLASARLARRIGMRLEAHLVENEWFKGRWIDELDFAILEQDWRTQHVEGCSFAFES
jgi:RimJ/RimL family protein N-acetyltransferase